MCLTIQGFSKEWRRTQDHHAGEFSQVAARASADTVKPLEAGKYSLYYLAAMDVVVFSRLFPPDNCATVPQIHSGTLPRKPVRSRIPCPDTDATLHRPKDVHPHYESLFQCLPYQAAVMHIGSHNSMYGVSTCPGTGRP